MIGWGTTQRLQSHIYPAERKMTPFESGVDAPPAAEARP